MRLNFFFILIILVLFSIPLTSQERGTKSFVIFGGNFGDVQFPHYLHQDSLKNCNLCHNLFPQVSGSILKLKSEGKLKLKIVMRQCIRCHKDKKSVGVKSGPIKCKDCHKK
ncbi:MAG: cytochrome c3 family protein [Spirochaetota bacterium]|nr:cytochrome c3 family protein [Spirochaetota bacterium]